MNRRFKKYFSNNVRWLVNADVFGTLKEKLDSIDDNRNLETVRDYKNKKIFKYSHNHESFYIKHYIVKHWKKIIRSYIYPTTKKEWFNAHKLLNNQVLTAEPLAVGEKKRHGLRKDYYLILKAIPNSITVRELLVEIQQSSASYPQVSKNALLREIIFYVRKIHDHGIFHGDLHIKNILVNIDNATLFYIIDLEQVKYRRVLPLSLRILDVSRLLYSIMDICTNEEITELIDLYKTFATPLQTGNSKYFPSQRITRNVPFFSGVKNVFSSENHASIYKDSEIFHQAVFKKIYWIRYKLWCGRTRKCMKRDKVTSHNNYIVNMRNEWDIKTLIGLINEHILSLKEGRDNILKVSSKIGITSVPLSTESTKRVCIKEYKYLSFSKQLLYSFHNSPARRAWFAAHGLMALNFQVPEPIALCEEKRFGILKKSFIIMEDASAFLPCNKYVIEKFGDPHDEVIYRRKQRFVSCLAESFRQLHDSGVYHGDLKANNIIVMESNDTWNFFYLDLDRVWFKKWLTLRKKIKNLSQLNASLPHCITYTDRLRFYRTYAGVKNLNDENKRIVRAIVRLSIQRKHVWNPKIRM